MVANLAKTKSSQPADLRLARLAEFLRARRRLLRPEDVGIDVTRRRRTPGLRRDDVAWLAGISVDWYTRIELGTVLPSASTLQAIARALQLSEADTAYLLELANVAIPSKGAAPKDEPLAALQHLILSAQCTAVEVFDLYGSPVCWNREADALFKWSSYPDAFRRNSIVAGLQNPYYQEFFGDDFDVVARGILGLFRRVYTTSEPTPLARRIYEFASSYDYFKQIWNEHRVSERHTPPGPVTRRMPAVGELKLDVADLSLLGRQDLIVRVIAPHDHETLAKFLSLKALGSAREFFDPNLDC